MSNTKNKSKPMGDNHILNQVPEVQLSIHLNNLLQKYERKSLLSVIKILYPEIIVKEKK